MSFDSLLLSGPPEIDFTVPPDATASPLEIADIKATLRKYLEELHEITMNHGGYPQNLSVTVVPEFFKYYTIINIGTAANNPYTGPNAYIFEEDALRILAELYGMPLGQDRWEQISAGSTTATLSAIVKANVELRGPPTAELSGKNTIIFAIEESHYAAKKNAYTTYGFYVPVPIEAECVKAGVPRTCKGIAFKIFASLVQQYKDHPIIAIATCGTTVRELRDDTAGMIAVFKEAGIPKEKFRVKIVGAYAGLASNMLDEIPESEKAKFHDGVFAIICSLHKKFGANRVGGIVIGKKTEGCPDGSPVAYLSGALDYNEEGLRNGAMALGFWIRLKLYAWQGYINQARRCADAAAKLAQDLVDAGASETLLNTAATTVFFPKPLVAKRTPVLRESFSYVI
jgi:glutamate/tyrosine decarboxylase-like PLP-dependent enzyme